MIAAMSLLAAMTRASSGRSSTRGTTSAARIPRITMTTSTSISVKPDVDRRAIRDASHAAIIIRRSGALRTPPSRLRSSPAVSRTFRSACPRRGAALIVAGAATVALGWWLSQPLPLPVSPFAFDVKPGASLKSVARDLVGAGILPHELPLVALARSKRRPVDQGGELRNRRGHHAAAAARQADAGRRHADRADGRRRQHVRRVRRGARCESRRS